MRDAAAAISVQQSPLSLRVTDEESGLSRVERGGGIVIGIGRHELLSG
jgi:hypothetical protein